jgi:hypothetical protein
MELSGDEVTRERVVEACYGGIEEVLHGDA